MASWKGRLSVIVGLLVALSLAACGSPEISNDLDVVNNVIENTGSVEPEPAPEPAPPRLYSFHEAAQRGLIEYRVTGNGNSSGASLQIEVRRTSSVPIRLFIAPGTVFRARSAGVQDMVARSIARELGELAADILDESGALDLVDEAFHNLLVEAYCDDFELDNPSAENSFTVDWVDARSAAILEAARAQGLSVAGTQAALWMDRGVSQEAIAERFPASPEDFGAASRLLGQLPPRG